jgi:hypothetical protein
MSWAILIELPPSVRSRGHDHQDENGRISLFPKNRRDKLRTNYTYWQLPQSLQNAGRQSDTPNTAQRSRASYTRTFLLRPALDRIIRPSFFYALFLHRECTAEKAGPQGPSQAAGLAADRSDVRILFWQLWVGKSLAGNYLAFETRGPPQRQVVAGRYNFTADTKVLE